MIGLGSNRLTVCRRGGMSVTQAGRGGMEWLAGDRMPSWASPYSAQATAALQAQVPTQWPTIRDYGFAHPEIVGYMNAYAPEDAKIAYSLVEGIGWRKINSDGSHHIDTGYKPNQKTRVVVEICRNQQVQTSGWDFPYGVGMYTQAYRMYICFYNNQFQIYAGQNNTTADYPATITNGQKYVVDESHVNSYIDGNLVATRTTQATTSPVNMWIGTCNNNNSNNGVAKAGFGNFRIYDDGALVRHFVPFIRESKVGMLDLLTDTFYQDNGNQSFTISETPAS